MPVWGLFVWSGPVTPRPTTVLDSFVGSGTDPPSALLMSSLFPLIGHPFNVNVAFSLDLVEFRVASKQNSVVLLSEGGGKTVSVSYGAIRLQVSSCQCQVRSASMISMATHRSGLGYSELRGSSFPLHDIHHLAQIDHTSETAFPSFCGCQ